MTKPESSLIRSATFIPPENCKLVLVEGSASNIEVDSNQVNIVLDCPGQEAVQVHPDQVQVISLGSYTVADTRSVECIPGSNKTIPIWNLTYEDVRFAHKVFDNLNAQQESKNLPFFMGKVSNGDLPVGIEYDAMTKDLWNFPAVGCNANVNKYLNGTNMRVRRRLVPKSKPEVVGVNLFQTQKEGCDHHTLKDKERARLCSHYFKSNMITGSENKIVENYGLTRWMEIQSALPAFNTDSKSISGPDFVLAEKDHVTGFRRQENLYCTVDLLLKGRKRWTLIDPAGNNYFQALSQILVKKHGEPIKSCKDPVQHNQFAIFFDDSYTSVPRYSVEQGPGEVMLLPPSVYYQVEVLEASVSVAFNCIDAQWCKLQPDDFESQCPHVPTKQPSTSLEGQRAAYCFMINYAKKISGTFLEQESLHPPTECLRTFSRKRRSSAIKAELDTDGPKPKRQKTKEQVPQVRRPHPDEDPASQNQIKLTSYNAPLYDPAVGCDMGKVLVEMMATHKCYICGRYFPNIQDARYHCSKEDITCCYCGRKTNNPYNKSVHENNCYQNPKVAKTREEKAATEKAEKEKSEAERVVIFATNAGQAPCKFCGKQFSFGNGLRLHETYCENNDDRREHKARTKQGRK